MVGICAQLMAILTDRKMYKTFLARGGQEAQSLLDLIQMVRLWPFESSLNILIIIYQLIDWSGLDPLLKRPLTSALIRLSVASGLYPECPTLRGVRNLQEINSVASGHFASVYKHRICGQDVAIKMLRVNGQSDIKKILKVRSFALKKNYMNVPKHIHAGVCARSCYMATALASQCSSFLWCLRL
jgi:hypothetical protein